MDLWEQELAEPANTAPLETSAAEAAWVANRDPDGEKTLKPPPADGVATPRTRAVNKAREEVRLKADLSTEDRLTTTTIDGTITRSHGTKTTLATAERKMEIPLATEVGESLPDPAIRAEALMAGKILERLVTTEVRSGTKKVMPIAILTED